MVGTPEGAQRQAVARADLVVDLDAEAVVARSRVPLRDEVVDGVGKVGRGIEGGELQRDRIETARRNPVARERLARQRIGERDRLAERIDGLREIAVEV